MKFDAGLTDTTLSEFSLRYSVYVQKFLKLFCYTTLTPYVVLIWSYNASEINLNNLY